jgi:hypothetical protein
MLQRRTKAAVGHLSQTSAEQGALRVEVGKFNGGVGCTFLARVIASLVSSPDRLWLIVRFASWRSWRRVRCRGRGPLGLCIGGLVDVSSGCEVSMNERNDRRSFAAGGCDAFHRAGAGVADGEHAGYGGGEAFGGKPVGP